MKHLLSTVDLAADQVIGIMALADRMAEVGLRSVPKVPALRGRTVASVFFEDSTRTRVSFETAAKRLSADTLTFNASTSSVNKGESLRDTIETLSATGVDLFVVRHRSAGAPSQVARWTASSVVNAGDGAHQHPTQALLDAYTISRALGTNGRLDGLRIAIVGDIRHSRVANSNLDLLGRLGAEVVCVAPPTLLPTDRGDRSVAVNGDLDDVIDEVDVLYMLRVQRERMASPRLPAGSEYARRFGLTPDRAARLKSSALVMHPGPMNRGTEIQVDPGRLAQSRVLDQVRNGVAIRMAVLFTLLCGEDMSEQVLGGES